MVTITSAESNRAVLRYVAEVSWGTTPGSGVSKAMRITQSGLVASKDTKLSEEIRADRMVPSIIEVAASSSGPIDYEFSAGSSDDFLEAFLLGTWSKAMNFFVVKGTGVNITGTHTITVPGDYTAWLADNQYIKTEGFLNKANNSYLTVNGAPNYSGGVTTITVDQSLTTEAGSAHTKVCDAKDVLCYATTVTFTSGNTVDGGGANAFGSVVVGQKVYLEGLGKETGTIQAAATDPAEGDTITISDGVDSVIFEIRTNSALVTPGHVYVALSGTPATMAASIGAAIMGELAKESFRCSASVSTDTVTVTNHRRTGGSIATSDGTAFTVVNFSGGSATKGGFYTVASVVDNDTFTTVETLSTDANSGTKPVLVKGSHLRNPGDYNDIVKRSVSVETGFTDVSKYFIVDGLRIGAFSLDVRSGEIVKGKLWFKGRSTSTHDSTTLGGGSFTVMDTTSTEVLNATANVGTIYKDGTALTTALTSITLDGDASPREQRAVGSKFPAGIAYGRFTMKGTVDAYFQDFTLYNDFIDHTTVALAFNMEDVDHNTYWFTLPAVKFTSDPISPEGIDKDVMEKLNFQAQRDPVLQTMFMVDRFSSTFPPTV